MNFAQNGDIWICPNGNFDFFQMGDFDILRISILDNLWYRDIEYIIYLVCIGFNPTSNEETLDIQKDWK